MLGACSDSGDSETLPTITAAAATIDPATDPPATDPPPTDPPTTESTTTTTVTTTTTTTTVAETTTTVAETTTTVVETTTTTAPPCVVQVQPGDSLFAIVARIGNSAVDVGGVQLENGIGDPDVIAAGQSLDVCVGNGIDDLTGAVRPPPTTAPPAPPDLTPPGQPPVGPSTGSGVAAQQEKLNALFNPYGLPKLEVDGRSGRLTRQALCAARVAFGLPVSRDDMAPGGQDEQLLMAAGGLPIPPAAPTRASKWAFIDQTCQVLFAGEGSGRLVFVFPTSTGQVGFPTRDQDASAVFRYDPALENGGWHDSIDYPVAGDNPLNGNMYKPLYFDDGQAIHGANSVPTNPASHGCVRLRVGNQDMLVAWLGLQDASGPVWKSSSIGLTVRVKGRY